jgi:hypothetical protein
MSFRPAALAGAAVHNQAGRCGMRGRSKGDVVTPGLRSTVGHLLLVTLRGTGQAAIGTPPYPGSLDPQPGSSDRA